VAMLTKLGPQGYAVHEDPVQSTVGIDSDSDTDPDAEGNRKLLIRDAPSRSGTASRSVFIASRQIAHSSQFLLFLNCNSLDNSQACCSSLSFPLKFLARAQKRRSGF